MKTEPVPVIARSKATKQSIQYPIKVWIASRSLSLGAHLRDPLARNDEWSAYAQSICFAMTEIGAVQANHYFTNERDGCTCNE